MKVVVIGGSGLIGTKLVGLLARAGHDVVAASPSKGIDTLTGKGLVAALADADVLVDVSNSPSFEDRAVLDFFETSGRNLIAAAHAAGVGHYVALSVVGSERLPDSGYFRAKLAQEALIQASGLPYTILRATQFFEFLDAIAASGAAGQAIRLPAAAFQPILSDDVAAALADVALAEPVNDTVELAGPDRLPMATLIGRYLAARGDARAVVADPDARYFGAAIDDRTLVPGANARLGAVRFEDWLARRAA